MVFVGLLGVTVAIPVAAAPDPDQQVAASQTTEAGVDSQTIVAAIGTAAVSRDGYTAKEAPPPAAVARAVDASSVKRTANTFTNNPNSPIQWPFPVGVPISDGFGPRLAPCGGCSSYHKGLDMNPGGGTPIQAIANGVVTVAQSTDNGGLGVYAEIEHEIDGHTITSVYGHMLEGSLQLRKGQVVTVGEQVGNVGNTGTSTGAHLHFEIHVNGTPVDPYGWMTSRVAP